MKRNGLAFLLLISLSVTICAQEQPPQLLMRAAHCLAVKQFFPASKARTKSFGFLVDEKSYPGQKVLYLVNYAAPDRSNGLVFTIFLTKNDGHQVFDIQNNAAFVLSRKCSDGVDFVGAPLGGVWTQEHLASAIRDIEKLPRFTISAKDLLTPTPMKGCEAYTDPFLRH